MPSRSSERSDAVQLLDATKARSRRFDAVVLGGLTAQEFSAERPEPLQARLEKLLGGRGGIEERLAERMLFYTLVTRAREKLVLVRQSSDASGESVRASVFWEDVVDLYTEPDENGDMGELPDPVKGRSVLLSDLAEAVPSFTESRRALRRDVERGTKVLRRPLSSELVAGEEHIERLSRFTVTELESYAACPYQWFVGRGLRPREIDSLLDAREKGIRAHEMLARFYALLPSRLGAKRVTELCVEEALVLFDEVAAEIEEQRRGSGAMTLAEEMDMAQARVRARRVVEADAEFLPGYTPVEFEWKFEYLLETDSAPVTLRGVVDRIDVGPEGLVVSDYKLGDATPQANWQKTRRMQVPLYASIASKCMELDIAGGVYRSLANGEARGFWRRDLGVPLGIGHRFGDGVDGESMKATIDWAWELVNESVEGIRAGRIEPDPAHDQACRYCLATTFCPKAVKGWS